jgi:hypothetical protein
MNATMAAPAEMPQLLVVARVTQLLFLTPPILLAVLTVMSRAAVALAATAGGLIKAAGNKKGTPGGQTQQRNGAGGFVVRKRENEGTYAGTSLLTSLLLASTAAHDVVGSLVTEDGDYWWPTCTMLSHGGVASALIVLAARSAAMSVAYRLLLRHAQRRVTSDVEVGLHVQLFMSGHSAAAHAARLASFEEAKAAAAFGDRARGHADSVIPVWSHAHGRCRCCRCDFSSPHALPALLRGLSRILYAAAALCLVVGVAGGVLSDLRSRAAGPVSLAAAVLSFSGTWLYALAALYLRSKAPLTHTESDGAAEITGVRSLGAGGGVGAPLPPPLRATFQSSLAVFTLCLGVTLFDVICAARYISGDYEGK